MKMKNLEKLCSFVLFTNTTVSGKQKTFTLSRIWNYIEPWIDKQQFAFTTFSVLVGGWFLYSTITKDKVASPADLLSVEGTLSKYSFTNAERGRKQYYVWLDEYSSTFQIPADFLSFFDKRNFEANAIVRQALSLKISRFDEKKLKEPNSKLFIYDLQQESYKFLNGEATLRQENSPLFYYAGTGFILAGIGYYFFRKRQLRRANR